MNILSVLLSLTILFLDFNDDETKRQHRVHNFCSVIVNKTKIVATHFTFFMFSGYEKFSLVARVDLKKKKRGRREGRGEFYVNVVDNRIHTETQS